MSVDVIIIDDDPASIFLYQTVVKKSELAKASLVFSNGQDALNYLDTRNHQDKLCLLLMDINVLPLSAWELLDQINLRPFADCISAIIISSSIDAIDRKKAKAFKQVIHCLEKPVDVKELQDKLKSLGRAFPERI